MPGITSSIRATGARRAPSDIFCGRIVRVRGRVRLTQEVRGLLRHGRGWELEVGANDHCMFLAKLEVLQFTPLDVRCAVGAWMVRHKDMVLPGGMTVAGTIMAEYGLSAEAYARRLVDPEAEARDDDASTGKRSFPQGTLLDLLCCCRRAPPPPPDGDAEQRAL